LIDSTEPRDPIDNTDAPLPARPDPVPIPPTIGLAEKPRPGPQAGTARPARSALRR
jgi:hypothetical protein